MKHSAATLACSLLLAGCSTGTFDLDEDLGFTGALSPEFAIPLGSGTITLDGLESFLDTEDFVLNEAGSEFVYVRTIPLFDVGSDVLTSWENESTLLVHALSSAEANVLNALPDGMPVEVSFALSWPIQGPGGCDMLEATFTGGSIALTLNAEGPIGGAATVTLPTLLHAGSPVSANCLVGGSVELPLAGCTWSVAGGVPVQVELQAVPGAGNSVPGDAISVGLALDASGWETISGDCSAAQPLDFTNVYSVDLFADRLNQTLHIAQPRVVLHIEHGQGISAQLAFNSFEVATASGSMDVGGPGVLSIPPLGPAFPIGSTVFWTHILTNENTAPSLSEVWDGATGEVSLSGTLDWQNAQGASSTIARSGRTRGALTLEFPFDGYASGFVLRDTLEVDLAGALADAIPEPLTWDDVEQVVVRISLENYLPIGGTLEGQFAAPDGTVLESIFAGQSSVAFAAGQIDFTLPDGHPDAGRVTAPGSATWDVVLEGPTAAYLVESGCDRLILRTVVQSHGAEDQRDVRLFPESSIRLALAARVDFNVVL
jgi:hypothetical protein